MEHLAERRGETCLPPRRRCPRAASGSCEGLDLLWSGYASPLYQAALDLWTHARTDPDLRERLVAVERRLDRETAHVSRRLFGELAERPGFERLLEMATATMRGLALLETLHPGSGRNRRQWTYCRERLVELLQALDPGVRTSGRVGPPAVG